MDATQKPFAVQVGWRPGLIGDIVREHAVYYAGEWSFGPFFEAKVAAEMAEFIARYDSEKDALFWVSDAEAFLGALTIDGSDPKLTQNSAHLRWFIVSAAARGHGVGQKLMQAAMDFLRAKGYRGCFLTTFQGLDAARRLYELHGFKLTEEQISETWGTRVTEQRFEVVLEDGE